MRAKGGRKGECEGKGVRVRVSVQVKSERESMVHLSNT